MSGFSFHSEADEEFVEAVAYYETCEPGLGLDLAREVHATIQNALDYPSMWPEIDGEVRRCLVHRFPYGVLYSIETHGTRKWGRSLAFGVTAEATCFSTRRMRRSREAASAPTQRDTLEASPIRNRRLTLQIQRVP